MHAFTDTNPAVHLDYTEFPDSYVEQKVLDDEYDIGLTPFNTENPALSYLPLFSKEIFFIVHPGSRFYDRQEVSIREALAEPLVLENDHFLIHHLLFDTAAKEGVTINPYFNTSGFSLCYKLCRKGEANTASMDFIFSDMAQDEIRMIPFSEHPMWPVALIHKKDVPISESMKAFILHTTKWKEKL
ncbi:MAG: LysR family transcriptional regulator substrate-binding protein [Lachnospiraceae bacterium]|nr:LysR family transcriptional regulator substrate-binding protein [Lachnospiraceae bacterium]